MRKFWKKKNKVVFTNGCFDIIHVGHVELINFCKSQGSELVVGLNSDESVRRLKGDGRPINSEMDRVKMLLALGADEVIVFDEDTPLKLIEEIMPNVLVKGSEWKGKVVGQDIVERAGGKVVLFDRVSNYSTTEIVNKIRREDNGQQLSKDAV